MPLKLDSRIALVLLSGGQDSATCLRWACEEYAEVYTLAFNYGQKHATELACSRKLSEIVGAVSHTELPIEALATLGDSALTTDGDVSQTHHSMDDLPASFVPGRNLIFLSLATACAAKLKAGTIVTGVCQTDYSGYPDCRRSFIEEMNNAANEALGMGFDKGPPVLGSVSQKLHIATPLMDLTKAQTVEMMQLYGAVDLYRYTHTCYNGQRPPCGECPACVLRAKGFEEVGIKDPVVENPWQPELDQIVAPEGIDTAEGFGHV